MQKKWMFIWRPRSTAICNKNSKSRLHYGGSVFPLFTLNVKAGILGRPSVSTTTTTTTPSPLDLSFLGQSWPDFPIRGQHCGLEERMQAVRRRLKLEALCWRNLKSTDVHNWGSPKGNTWWVSKHFICFEMEWSVRNPLQSQDFIITITIIITTTANLTTWAGMSHRATMKDMVRRTQQSTTHYRKKLNLICVWPCIIHVGKLI